MKPFHLHLNCSSLRDRYCMTDSERCRLRGRDAHAGQAPDHVSEYLAAIQRMAPLIADHRRSFDHERRLPDFIFRALADAGLFRLWLPGTLGGPELSPVEFMTIVEAASALDASVGWLVGNGGGMSRIGGYLPETVVRSWFCDSQAFVVSATGSVGTAQR